MTTPAPLDVFDCPLDGSALVEAGAGTGKTWNICGLVLRLLLERGLELSQVLVVTFTNAATAELRERIRGRLVDVLAGLRGDPAAAADPFVAGLIARQQARGLDATQMRERLERALGTFDEAAILTIHGFCQRALAEAPFAAGTPMRLELLPDDAALRLQVVQDFWRRHVAGDATPAGRALAEQLIAKKDSPARWADLLKRQVAKPLARLRWPDGIDDVAADIGRLVAERQRLHGEARAVWWRERAAIVGGLSNAAEVIDLRSYKPEQVEKAAAAWDEMLRTEVPCPPPKKSCPERFGSAALSKRKKTYRGPGIAPHAFHVICDALLDVHRGLEQAHALARARLLRRLFAEGPATLRELKRERRVVAFDDLLDNLHRRVTGDGGAALASALRQRFPAALIDEFQDTDPLQFGIFRAIYLGAGDGPPPAGVSMFLVGDPKQAIYAFRNADLPTYLGARAQVERVWALTHNQRSTPALLRGLNALWGANPRAFWIEGLQYATVDAGARPRPPLDDESGVPRAALQLWQLPAGDDGKALSKAAAQALARRACAAEVARLVTAGLDGTIRLAGRPLTAGDIAVLVRSHAHGAAMRRELEALGVGCVELSQASVFASPEAEAIERLLAAVLQPAREALVKAALATELAGLDAAAIAALDEDEDTWLGHLARFADDREAWARHGIGVMLRGWMQRERVAARLLARPDGERRMTNLLHLVERLQAAAATEPTPIAQLRWLQAARREGEPGEDAQLRLESDRNLVQIVTVHRSKGLEYPVTVCPLLWDGHPGPRSPLEGCEYHDDDGVPVIDLRDEVGDDVRRRRRLEQSAETARLLYVALTRAVHRCVLVVGRYAIGQSDSQSCGSGLNWLVAGAGRSPEDWLGRPASAGEVDAAWAALAAGRSPEMRLDPLPEAPGRPVPPRPEDADRLAALPAPARLPPPWRIGSYSSLAGGLRHERAAIDHDQHGAGLDATPVAAPAAARIEPDDILLFPRGATAGECLHAVFEHARFDDRRTWPGAVERALRLQPPDAGARGRAAPRQGDTAADRSTHARRLMRMLGDVLASPLPCGLRLETLPGTRRLTELEFSLPAPALDARRLQATMRAHGWPVPALAFGRLHGYLRGFIDLVCEHDGRFHVIDWKSNHLGDTPADYAPAALDRAMAAHGYPLQALLYAVALHRYLRHRLPDYAPERHFGEVNYLFVRGLRPGWQAGGGLPCGIARLRPTPALLEQASALFDAPDAPPGEGVPR